MAVERDESRRACMLCGKEFSEKLEVCPEDGTLLTPVGNEPRPGEVFADRYEILGLIGDGGMGKVFKARHSLMKRLVAIKILLPHLVKSGTALKRFQQEAQAASALKHPHIMTVHDFGISAKGMPFLVMDYLEGMSLAALLQELGSVPQDRAVNIFIQACSALSHAHKNGVIHRDLKPANMMLIDFDGQPDFVMIVDFGIAKLKQPEAGEPLTHTGEVFGSPLYMSPEQCRGDELDIRSDIYSLGSVLYRTVTGRPMVTGRDAMECMYKQVNSMPGSFIDVCPELGLSDKLESIVFKAVAKDPDERYQTMAQFREALDTLRGQARPVNKVFSVPPKSGQEVAYDAGTDRLKRPAPISIIRGQSGGMEAPPQAEIEKTPTDPREAVPAAAAAAQPVTSVEPVPVAVAGSTPELQFSGQASPSGAVSVPKDQTGSAISDPDLSATAGSIAAAEPNLAALSQETESTTQTSPSRSVTAAPASGSRAVQAEPITSTTSGLSNLSDPAQIQAAAESGAGIAFAGSQPQSPLVDSSGSITIAASMKQDERPETSMASPQTGPGEPPAVAKNKPGIKTIVALVVGLLITGLFLLKHHRDESPVQNPGGNSTTTSSKQAQPVDENTASGKNVTQARTEIAHGKYQNAEKSLHSAVDSAANDRELMDVLPLQARVLEQSGKYEQSQQAWSKLLSIQEKLKASPADIAITKSKLALPLLDQEKVDEAEPLLNDAEKALANVPGKEVGLSQVYYGLSKVALKRGDYNKACETLQKGIAIRIKGNGAADPELLQFWQDLAEVYLVQGNLADAEDALNRTLKLAGEHSGKDSVEAADAYKGLGIVYIKKGKLSKAENYLKKALDIKRSAFGDDSVSAAEVMASLAILYASEKKYSLAEPLFKKSLDIRTRELGADSPQAKRSKELLATFEKARKGKR